MPMTAVPTMAMPSTAPARNATLKAGLRASLAATAERRLALTAMLMPRYPASAEQVAPATNASAVQTPSSGLPATPVTWPISTDLIMSMLKSSAMKTASTATSLASVP